MENQKATFGINKFSDLSEEEFSHQYKMKKFNATNTCIWPYHKIRTFTEEEKQSIPSTFDWYNFVFVFFMIQERSWCCDTSQITGKLRILLCI